MALELFCIIIIFLWNFLHTMLSNTIQNSTKRYLQCITLRYLVTIYATLQISLTLLTLLYVTKTLSYPTLLFRLVTNIKHLNISADNKREKKGKVQQRKNEEKNSAKTKQRQGKGKNCLEGGSVAEWFTALVL